MPERSLQGAPFGRRLGLLIYRLPRQAPAKFCWELEQGFHLQVLSGDLFELHLRSASGSTEPLALPILGGDEAARPPSKLLLWQRPQTEQSNWQEFDEALASCGPWQAAVILSHTRSRLAALTRYPSLQRRFRHAGCPVVELFQDAAPETFFTVEKNLFVLGRVGRRLERYLRWRGRLPG